MIECLSCESWINPQIDFLVFLQNIRMAHFEGLDKLFLSVTILGEFWLPTVLCAIVYWCIDSKSGIYLFSLCGLNLIFNQFFKMVACVYRPWILNSRVQPVELAKPLAIGYSFPSGHSAMASSILGGIAYLLRKKKIIMFSLILLILTVGFSRLWLGVHTPQDVVTGLAIGFILIFVVNSLINWAERNNTKSRYLCILTGVNVLACIFLSYICYFCIYPCDYVDGKILVDSAKAIYASVSCYGYSLGLINGCILTRVFSPFDSKAGTKKQRIIRGILGVILILILSKLGLAYIFSHTLDNKLNFALNFIIGFFITAIYPIMFKKVLFQ